MDRIFTTNRPYCPPLGVCKDEGPRQRNELRAEGLVRRSLTLTIAGAGLAGIFGWCVPTAAKILQPPSVVIPLAARQPVVTRVPMRKDGGVYVIPVALNDTVSLECI